MNTPEIGDSVLYWGRMDNLVRGILAERAISPLTGNPRYRVVDSFQEMKDEEAGRWVDVLEVQRIDAPALPHVETGETKWGVRFATAGAYRMNYFPRSGGRELLVNADAPNGVWWILAGDDGIPEAIERALCAALGLAYTP